MITNDINFVLETCCREARACTVDSRSLSMCNRLHKVLGGRVQYTCTIYSFPGYCLELRTRQKVFFRCLIPFIHLLTLLSLRCWDLAIFMLIDNRRQINRLLYLLLRMHACGIISCFLISACMYFHQHQHNTALDCRTYGFDDHFPSKLVIKWPFPAARPHHISFWAQGEWEIMN